MKRHMFAGRRWTAVAVAVVALGAIVALASPAAAQQSCYNTSGYIYDICNSYSEQVYSTYPANTQFFVSTSGYNRLLFGLNNDLEMFELGSNPLQPQQVASLHIPWDWGTIDVGGSTHEQYIQHLVNVATAPGYQYALVSLLSYGWDFLRVGSSPAFLGVGFHPSRVLANSYYYTTSILYQDGSNVYAIAPRLDETSVDNNDSSWRIYLIDNGGSINPTNTGYSNMGQGVRIPVGQSTDPPGFTDSEVYLNPTGAWRFEFAEVGGHNLLFARRASGQYVMLVIDVTDPNNPIPAVRYTSADLPYLFKSDWVVNKASNGTTSIWASDNQTATLYQFNVTVNGAGTPSIAYVGSTCWAAGSPCPAMQNGLVGAAGDLVAVGYQRTIGYLSLTGGSPQLLSQQDGFTNLVRPACADPQYEEKVVAVNGLAPLEIGGQYYVGRAMEVDADVMSVSAGCMSTVPIPSFTVSGGEASATCNPAAADDGFPGDTFTITNTSVGAYDTATLDLYAPGGAEVAGFPKSLTPGSAPVTWTAPATGTGSYTATLSIAGGTPPSYSNTIAVCANPKAALSLSPGSQVLTGQQVTLNAAASAGAPNAYRFWVTTPGQSSSELPGSGPSRTYTPSDAGQYTVGVVAQYLFPATNDTACSTVPIQSLLAGGVYNSCSSATLIAGFGISSFEVWQNGVKVADSSNSSSSNPGVLLVDQQTTLKFTGQLAVGYTPYFAWTIPGGVTPGNCAYTAPPYTGSTCTIPANTFAVGSPFVMNMTLHACLNGTPGLDCGGTNSVPAPPVWVVPSLNTFSFTAAPSTVNIGQTVTVTLTAITGSFQSLTFDLGGTACDGSTQLTVSCLSPFGNLCQVGTSLLTFSYQGAGAKTIQGTGQLTGGGTANAAGTTTVNVNNQGACTCPDVSVNLTGPTTATVNQPVQFSATASAGSYSITGYSWTFGDGGSATGQTVSHTYTSAGTRTVTVTATSACGNSGSRSQSVYVGNGGGGGGTLTMTPNPASAPVGSTITFTFSPALTQSSDALTFVFGDGQSSTLTYSVCHMFNSCGLITHTYTQAGTFGVTASGIAGGGSVSGSTSVSITGNCGLPNAPTANFTFSPGNPGPGDTIQFTDTSTGTPTSWLWQFGDGTLVTRGGSSTQENPTYAYTAAGTYTVSLTAVNCKGSSTTTRSITVASCTATQVPTANFSWSPNAPETVNGVVQNQPYAGETVTLTDASSNQPISWHWDFGDGTHADVTSATTTHVWASPGTYTVTLTATNCIGASQPFAQAITVAADVRPVIADFSWNPTQPGVGQAATFTAAQGSAYGDPTSFTWVFSDDPSNPVQGVSVSHAFSCGGAVQVSLTAARNGITGTTPKAVQVSGTPLCGPQAVVSGDAAKAPGLNGTYWQTDMRIFNPTDQAGSVTLGVLPVSQDNTQPFELPTVALAPHTTLVLDDIIQSFIQAGAQVQKAAILTTFPNGDPVPVVASRTYTQSVLGGTYGQSVNGVQVWPGTQVSPLWITGIRNDGATTGFRTNFGLTNLLGNSSAAGVQVTIVSPTGAALANKTISLPPYGFLQDSINNIFGPGLDSIGPFAVKIETPAGVDVEPYCSLVDNQTGDPTLIGGEGVVQGTVFLPAVAHLNGLNGTVWRSDIQFTNPDGVARQWNVSLIPKQFPNAIPGSLSLGPGNSLAVSDVINWLYQGIGANPPDTVSGVIQVTSADGGADLPIVAARTYNLTSAGTYGNGIPALDASQGATATGVYQHLYLTGMSSDDVARSNLGFVDIGTGSVNFDVLLYDESGNLLNPNGTPIQISLGPGGWDQDLLENRFQNTFGTSLPAGLRAVSAVITVVSGGPGYAYASVVDNVTGDPVFIGAQLAP
jgi:PKD repeat protein